LVRLSVPFVASQVHQDLLALRAAPHRIALDRAISSNPRHRSRFRNNWITHYLA